MKRDDAYFSNLLNRLILSIAIGVSLFKIKLGLEVSFLYQEFYSWRIALVDAMHLILLALVSILIFLWMIKARTLYKIAGWVFLFVLFLFVTYGVFIAIKFSNMTFFLLVLLLLRNIAPPLLIFLAISIGNDEQRT